MIGLYDIKGRVKQARVDSGLAQADVAEKLSVSRGTVTAWELGKNIPSISTLAEMADIFNCDIEYLLGRCAEKHRATADVAESTGLSEDAAELLVTYKQLGTTSLVSVLNALLYDMKFKNISGKQREREHRPIIDLLQFFFKYSPTVEERKAVWPTGEIVDVKGKNVDSNAIIIDNQMVENAVLLEIQRALVSLREGIRAEKKPPRKGGKGGTHNATDKK